MTDPIPAEGWHYCGAVLDLARWVDWDARVGSANPRPPFASVTVIITDISRLGCGVCVCVMMTR